MAKISNWTLVSTIQSEIQREQNDLKYVDENLMRLTGRDFNEPPRGDRRIRVVSGTKEDEPQPKPRYPKGVFARLGAPVLEGTVKPRARRVREVSEEDGEPPKKKPLIASSVARPTFDSKTRTEAAAELTKDRASRDRNRRMFGSLLGTLQRFKTEEAKLKDKDDKRAKVELKLEEKGRAEKELLRQERIDLINQRKERQARIHRLNIKMARVKEHESWEKYQRQLQKFIRTKSTPKIFWFPKVTNARCLHLISATKENIEKELEDERLRLKKELEELLGERFQGDVADDELEEEYSEGLRREPDEPFRGGMGEAHFSNGSSLNKFETEEGELMNDEGEPWLSGKKGQNSERFVIKVDSVNEAPMRRVEIVTVAAPNARRVKEERVDKDMRVRERVKMESLMENMMNGKQKENDSIVRKASFKTNDNDKEKNKLKEKERKKHEKACNKERDKLRSVVKDSSQQRIVLEATKSDNLNSEDEINFPGKKIESPILPDIIKLDSEKHSKKSKGKNETKENKELTIKHSQKNGKDINISENDINPVAEIMEENVVSQKSKSLSEVEKNRSGKRDYKLISDSKDAEDVCVDVDSNDQEKRNASNDGKGTLDKERMQSQTDDISLKDKRHPLKDSQESHEEERRSVKENVIAKDKRQPPIDGKDAAGRESQLSQKEEVVIPEKKRHHQKVHKNSSDKEKKQSHKDGRSLKDCRNSADKDKSQSLRGEKDRNKSEKDKSHTTVKESFEKEKKLSSKVSKADKEDHGKGKSQREDKLKTRKRKAVEEGIDNDDMDAEEIWSEDLSHISLPLEPEPAVTEVVVQRVPISEDGQEYEEDDQSDMQVESMMIPVSQIKKDKSVWEPVPFHQPIVIKKEKDPSPVTDKKAEKESERKKRASESSSESSDSEGSSSDSEESSEDPSSSNSSDSSSESDGGRTDKKKKAESKSKHLETKKERMGKEKGRRNAKRKEDSSSSSSEDESSSSSSSESEESSSEDEKVGKKIKDNKKGSSKATHKVKTFHSKEISSRDKEKTRKSGKAMPLDKMEDLKKKMDEEAERMRQRIIRGGERKSKSRERVKPERQIRDSKQRERSRERKKARK